MMSGWEVSSLWFELDPFTRVTSTNTVRSGNDDPADRSPRFELNEARRSDELVSDPILAEDCLLKVVRLGGSSIRKCK